MLKFLLASLMMAKLATVYAQDDNSADTPSMSSASANDECVVSEGDLAAGLQSVQDESCLTEGKVGCIADTGCRLCLTRENPDYVDYVMCGDIGSDGTDVSRAEGDECKLAQADIDAGLRAYYYPACEEGGIGCDFKTMCRYCKADEHDENVGDYPYCDGRDEPCKSSEGNLLNGIDSYYDPTCATSDELIGCYGENCRYCALEGSENVNGYRMCLNSTPGSSASESADSSASEPGVSSAGDSAEEASPPANGKVLLDPKCPASKAMLPQVMSWLSDPTCVSDEESGCFASDTDTPCRFCLTKKDAKYDLYLCKKAVK